MGTSDPDDLNISDHNGNALMTSLLISTAVSILKAMSEQILNPCTTAIPIEICSTRRGKIECMIDLWFPVVQEMYSSKEPCGCRRRESVCVSACLSAFMPDLLCMLISVFDRQCLVCLSLESERCADLVSCLAQILCVERGAETEGDACAELDVVGQCCDAAVIDLGLFDFVSRDFLRRNRLAVHLRERAGIKLVFARNLKTNVVTCFGVPGGLRTSFYLAVDLVIIAGGEDAQVVGSLDSSGVLRQTVANGCRVFGHSGFLNIIACLGAN